ncbi:hypothetical protein BDZ89DRAFT_1164747 [Hymenopellis radicata]|nr:hypothetical protein BDZ89DRAFT_1164747 [Hymenopellis radicata]
MPQVELILGVRGRLKYKTPEYLVKWYGYPALENSWEPASACKADMRDLLKAVWRQIKEEGLTKDDFAFSSLKVELDPLYIFHDWGNAP